MPRIYMNRVFDVTRTTELDVQLSTDGEIFIIKRFIDNENVVTDEIGLSLTVAEWAEISKALGLLR